MLDRAALARRAPQWLRRLARLRAIPTRWWEDRLWLGFASHVLPELEQRAGSWVVWRRLRARAALARWRTHLGEPVAPWWRVWTQVTTARVQRRYRHNPAWVVPAAREVAVDVLLVSDFSLLGGTSSSNAQEIAAQAQAGVVTGVMHHPVWDWQVTKAVAERIAAVVDGRQVVWVRPQDHVRAAVTVVRAPRVAQRLLDGLAAVDRGTTVVIVNQTPHYHYDAAGGHGHAYDLRPVVDNLQELQPRSWHPIGPAVREAMVRWHADVLDPARLGEDWVNIIDAQGWTRPGGPKHAGPPRIGRHSRDHQVKWPENAQELRAIYPTDGSADVRVLGGAHWAGEVLGRVPRAWTVYPFGSRDVKEFLAELDVYVYYTHSTYTEAFGRAPLEAMAVGVPVICAPVFAPLFGEAAVYAAPAEVADAVAELMAHPDQYQRQVQRGWDAVDQRFSHSAHLRRLRALGLRA